MKITKPGWKSNPTTTGWKIKGSSEEHGWQTTVATWKPLKMTTRWKSLEERDRYSKETGWRDEITTEPHGWVGTKSTVRWLPTWAESHKKHTWSSSEKKETVSIDWKKKTPKQSNWRPKTTTPVWKRSLEEHDETRSNHSGGKWDTAKSTSTWKSSTPKMHTWHQQPTTTTTWKQSNDYIENDNLSAFLTSSNEGD